MNNYELTQEMSKQIEESFTYHKPKLDQPERYERLRSEAKTLAYLIVSNTPTSREQSLALNE